ncbi:hypothetical protein C0Q70_01031 [Pomacea canaliculata]|uniref:Uncharacterized protein n=1 Tax=Pomacea canaliculata TaxID=400727 RepID=A0A2T7PYB2_POMCA|nr:hypothetical protein C0Q70_01031 [Pomacea canaliculata]
MPGRDTSGESASLYVCDSLWKERGSAAIRRPERERGRWGSRMTVVEEKKYIERDACASAYVRVCCQPVISQSGLLSSFCANGAGHALQPSIRRHYVDTTCSCRRDSLLALPLGADCF